MNKVHPVLLFIFVCVLFLCANLFLFFFHDEKRNEVNNRLLNLKEKITLAEKTLAGNIDIDPELQSRLAQLETHFHNGTDSFLLSEGEWVKQKIDWHGIELVKYLVDETKLSFSIKGQVAALFELLNDIEKQELFWNINGVSLRYQKEYYSLDFVLEPVVMPSDEEIIKNGEAVVSITENNESHINPSRLSRLFKKTEKKVEPIPEIVDPVEEPDIPVVPEVIYSEAPEWLSFVGVTRDNQDGEEKYLFMDSRTGKVKSLQKGIADSGWEFAGIEPDGYHLKIDDIDYLLFTRQAQ